MFFMPGSFRFKFSENFNIALRYMRKESETCLELFIFKMAIRNIAVAFLMRISIYLC